MQAKDVAAHLDRALLKRLEVRRFGDKNAKKKQRGVKVPAGQSYSKLEEEEEEAEDSSMEDSEDETEHSSISDSEKEIENSDAEEMISGFEWMEELGADRLREEELREEELRAEELPDLDIAVPRKNLTAYVVAAYEGQWFLAEICKDQTNVDPGYTRLNYMIIKGKNSFAWGLKEDIHVALDEDILIEPVLPEPVNSRSNMGLRKKDLDKVLLMMVVVYLPFVPLVFFPSSFLVFFHIYSRSKLNFL
jgi:hypothetical protein